MLLSEPEDIFTFFLFFTCFYIITFFAFQPDWWKVFPCQRCSGQDGVTGVVPSSPRYVAVFWFFSQRVQHSHCLSIFFECSSSANSRSRAFRYFMHMFSCKKMSLRTSMHSVRDLEPTKLILTDTRTTYQA